MILILGGTTEGRGVAAHLRLQGYDVLLSTATDFCDQADCDLLTRTGPLDGASLAALIKAEGIEAVVDATHPFARRITALAKDVCADKRVAYFRYERGPIAFVDDSRIHRASTIADGACEAASIGRRVFLATGVKTLGEFVSEGRRISDSIEYFARILPWAESLKESLKWLPPRNIIAAVGPFSVDFNLACFKSFDVDTLVTKDSGSGSGTEEKIAAAIALDINIIVVERPSSDGPVVSDFNDLTSALDSELSRREMEVNVGGE